LIFDFSSRSIIVTSCTTAGILVEAKDQLFKFCRYYEGVVKSLGSSRFIKVDMGNAGGKPPKHIMKQMKGVGIDYVLVDEAGQATVPELLIPLTLAAEEVSRSGFWDEPFNNNKNHERMRETGIDTE
jgi:hypothetical protein